MYSRCDVICVNKGVLGWVLGPNPDMGSSDEFVFGPILLLHMKTSLELKFPN